MIIIIIIIVIIIIIIIIIINSCRPNQVETIKYKKKTCRPCYMV